MKKYLVYNYKSHCIIWKYLEGSNNQYMCIQCTDTRRMLISETAMYVEDGPTLVIKTDDYDEAVEIYLLEAVSV